MLAGSRQWMPKVAYVFDDDVDIYSEERVKWAQAWRLPSSPREFHPEALTEPYVTVSRHTARATH
jgi:hypothetical protein